MYETTSHIHPPFQSKQAMESLFLVQNLDTDYTKLNFDK